MPIRYKVITKKRKSAAIHGNSPFCLEYPKGKVVTAPEGTLGIMTFRTKEQAENFAGYGRLKNIKVEGIGVGRIPNVIGFWKTDDIRNFYLWLDGKICAYFGENQAPYGTICYQSVKVLE